MSSVEQRARGLLAPIEVAINKLREEMGWYANAYADPADEAVEAIAAALREQPEARGVVDGLPWELRQPAKHAGVVTGELLNKAADALDALTAAQPQLEGGGEVGEVYGPKATSTMVALHRPLPPGTKLYAAPPSAPVGVDDDDDDELVERVARAIATEGFGRQREDFHELCVHDTDKSDLREYALAAISSLAQQPAQAAPGANTEFARIGDMSPTVALRVGTDSDCDVYLSVTGDPGEGVEFCTSGPGGGKSPRTREALVALMDAIRQDNIEDPRRDWWARRNIPTPPGDDAAGGGL